jgi:hypothetical protein
MGFAGRPSKTERQFEAHLFLTCDDSSIDRVVKAAARRRFRRSSRIKQSGASNDILLTRNSDDEAMLTEQLRLLADDLVGQGVYVYRLRLEAMVFDEVRLKSGAKGANRDS